MCGAELHVSLVFLVISIARAVHMSPIVGVGARVAVRCCGATRRCFR
jgi:hypothetical protein